MSSATPSRLQSARLVTDGASIVLVAPDGDLATDLVEQPGANRLAPTLGDVFAPFTNQRGHRVVALLQPRRHLAVDPETLGGYPVVSGTRVAFDSVASLVRDGVSPAEIKLYPSVSAAGARERSSSPTRSTVTSRAASGRRGTLLDENVWIQTLDLLATSSAVMMWSTSTRSVKGRGGRTDSCSPMQRLPATTSWSQRTRTS